MLVAYSEHGSAQALKADGGADAGDLGAFGEPVAAGRGERVEVRHGDLEHRVLAAADHEHRGGQPPGGGSGPRDEVVRVGVGATQNDSDALVGGGLVGPAGLLQGRLTPGEW